MIPWLISLFRRKPRQHHVWKEEAEENLGSYMHFGSNVHDMDTMYRIAVHERCLVTGETRVRERHDLFPVKEPPKPPASSASSQSSATQQ